MPRKKKSIEEPVASQLPIVASEPPKMEGATIQIQEISPYALGFRDTTPAIDPIPWEFLAPILGDIGRGDWLHPGVNTMDRLADAFQMASHNSRGSPLGNGLAAVSTILRDSMENDDATSKLASMTEWRDEVISGAETLFADIRDTWDGITNDSRGTIQEALDTFHRTLFPGGDDDDGHFGFDSYPTEGWEPAEEEEGDKKEAKAPTDYTEQYRAILQHMHGKPWDTSCPMVCEQHPYRLWPDDDPGCSGPGMPPVQVQPIPASTSAPVPPTPVPPISPIEPSSPPTDLHPWIALRGILEAAGDAFARAWRDAPDPDGETAAAEALARLLTVIRTMPTETAILADASRRPVFWLDALGRREAKG